MGAVHVRVRHDDDLVVAQLVGGELVASDAGPERGDERADLLGRQHLVETHALDIEDFASQRQYRLEGAVAALFGAAAGGVALDDEELRLRRVALLAICKLPRQRGDAQRALARHLARLARGLACRRGLDDLVDDDLGFRGMLLEPILQRLVEQVLHHRAHLGGDELVLGLRGEFRIRHLAGQDRGEALAAIVAGERDLLLLRAAALLGIAGDLAGQRAAKAGKVSAAVALRNGVGEAQHGLVVAVVPPQRALDRDSVALGLDHDRGGNERGLVAVEIPHERLDPALVEQDFGFLDGMPQVGEHDPHARIEEGEFAQPVLQRRVIELGHGERPRARQERHLGAALDPGPGRRPRAAPTPRRRGIPWSAPGRRARS